MSPKGFLVGGAEAVAHLAAISAMRIRDRHQEVKLTGQNLIVPTTIALPGEQIPKDWTQRLLSHKVNFDPPILNEKLYEMLVEVLGLPDAEERKGENLPQSQRTAISLSAHERTRPHRGPSLSVC